MRASIETEYWAQAERFVVLAQLASQHAAEEIRNSSSELVTQNFSTFEGVSVAVCHGLAIELYLKGLLINLGESDPRGHNLQDLLERDCLKETKIRLETEWDAQGGKKFVNCMGESKRLFEDGRYFFEPDKKDQKANKQGMRVNASFTSFLAKKLRAELKQRLGSG